MIWFWEIYIVKALQIIYLARINLIFYNKFKFNNIT